MRFLLLSLALCFAAVSASAQYRILITLDNVSAHTGRQVGIRLYDRTTSSEAVRYIEREIPEGNTYFKDLWGLVTGHDYNVDVYIDVNANGRYDAPPTDLAWRQTFNAVAEQITTTFDVAATTTDIEFPNPQPGTLHFVSKSYVGSWNNESFSTTGNASANSYVDYGADTVYLSMTTNGAFGIPGPMTMVFTGTLDEANDSADLAPQAPATGFLRFVRGRVFGVITLESPPVQLEINGAYGANQVMFGYGMSGPFNAFGNMTLVESTATDVRTESISSPRLTPNPTIAASVVVSSNVPFDRVMIHDLAGALILSATCDVSTSLQLDLGGVASGLYLVSTQLESGARSTSLLVR